MPFFKSLEEIQKDAKKNIDKAKDMLSHIDIQNKSSFLDMLDKRNKEFNIALAENPGPVDRRQIIQQYLKFTNTLLLCLKKPDNRTACISEYINDPLYYLVQSKSLEKTTSTRQKISGGTAILGAAIIVASIPTFFFNLAVGLTLLAIGITILAASLLSWATPDSPDPKFMKIAEELLFQEGAELIANFKESLEHEPPRAACTM